MKIYNEHEFVTSNFNISELACKDGTINAHVIKVCIEKLQPFRTKLGIPLNIVSAFRSPEYNKKIGGESQSKHMLGEAFDILWTAELKRKFKTIDAFKDYCIKEGVKGIGLYNTFVHIDWRTDPNPRGYSFWDLRG